MDPQNKKVVIPQGYMEIPCRYCGEPMTVAKGSLTREFDNKGKVVNETRANDQVAYFHKKCRKDGRREANEQRKFLIQQKYKK